MICFGRDFERREATMAGTDIAVKKDVVRLSAEEREATASADTAREKVRRSGS